MPNTYTIGECANCTESVTASDALRVQWHNAVFCSEGCRQAWTSQINGYQNA